MFLTKREVIYNFYRHYFLDNVVNSNVNHIVNYIVNDIVHGIMSDILSYKNLHHIGGTYYENRQFQRVIGMDFTLIWNKSSRPNIQFNLTSVKFY